jgi:hypothetical protein
VDLRTPVATAFETWGGGTVDVRVRRLRAYPRLVAVVTAGNRHARRDQAAPGPERHPARELLRIRPQGRPSPRHTRAVFEGRYRLSADRRGGSRFDLTRSRELETLRSPPTGDGTRLTCTAQGRPACAMSEKWAEANIPQTTYSMGIRSLV